MENQTFTNKIAVAALVLAAMGVFLFATGIVYATPYGTEITIHDGLTPNGLGTAYEDNEAELGMVQSQAWDLEGFFLLGKNLTIVGGYNFYTGKDDMDAGDIFIDTDGDAVYSPNTIPGFNYDPGLKLVSNANFKYNYVLDIDWKGSSGAYTYQIVKLNSDSWLQDTTYGEAHNKPSNPWIYARGGEIKYTGSFTTYDKASMGDTGFNGWVGTSGADKHYVATFDLTSEIDISNGAVFHNTMECGNDNLMGKSAPVPEPSTLILIVTGLMGIGLVRRRIRK